MYHFTGIFTEIDEDGVTVYRTEPEPVTLVVPRKWAAALGLNTDDKEEADNG